MNILLLHTFYREPGGEDRVFDTERALLEEHGECVSVFTGKNPSRAGVSKLPSFVMSSAVASRLTSVLEASRPDVAHVHNTFTALSPVVYDVLRQKEIPVVQTLHNFRWICPAGTLWRSGRFCNECAGMKIPLPSIAHRCYRNSMRATLGAAVIIGTHGIRGTIACSVGTFISPSRYLKRQYAEAGFDAARIVVEPHTVPDPGGGDRTGSSGPVIFVGRLSQEKGTEILLRAWKYLPDIPLSIVGDGPMRRDLRRMVDQLQLKHVRLLGRKTPDEVRALIRGSSLLVAPSLGPESFGLTPVEAFACGVPVVAFSSGALAETVRHGWNGLLCAPGDAEGLAAAVRSLFSDPDERRRLGTNGRKDFEERYSPAGHYRRLMKIYSNAGTQRAAPAS